MSRRAAVRVLKRTARQVIPAALIGVGVHPATSRAARLGAIAGVLAIWTEAYRRYRRRGLAQTERERKQLESCNWDAFWRHYNERVPTIEEEFNIWGAYHQHRHEMRYDLVAKAVRDHLPRGGAVLDIGCGSALVADRILDQDAHYLGCDFGGHHIEYAAKKMADVRAPLQSSFVRCDGEHLPMRDTFADVVVLTEVIEHLLRPELAVWEIARVLRPGGVFIMTTNNASEVPLRSPLTHAFAWLEKALGAGHPRLISYRPWVWPVPVDQDLLPEGSPSVYLPHTHHIMAETRDLFAAAGLEMFSWSTFEFPPPQSETAQRLDKQGAAGRRIVDVIEGVARRTPLIRRLGAHHLMLCRKVRDPVAPTPPLGIWPGPFSNGRAPGFVPVSATDRS